MRSGGCSSGGLTCDEPDGRLEMPRALATKGRAAVEAGRAAIDALVLLPLDDLVLDAAAALGPPDLRSLDAVQCRLSVLARRRPGVLVT